MALNPVHIRGSQTVAPRGEGIVDYLGGRDVFMRDISILNKIWAQHKIHILVAIARLKYFTYHLVPALAPNYKQHILSPNKFRKEICHLLPRFMSDVFT
jgi:hypothetical protein